MQRGLRQPNELARGWMRPQGRAGLSVLIPVRRSLSKQHSAHVMGTGWLTKGTAQTRQQHRDRPGPGVQSTLEKPRPPARLGCQHPAAIWLRLPGAQPHGMLCSGKWQRKTRTARLKRWWDFSIQTQGLGEGYPEGGLWRADGLNAPQSVLSFINGSFLG